MERLTLSSCLFFARFILILFTLSVSTITYAASGCCSKHGGVKGCDAATNHLMCADGSNSPSCMCDNTTLKVAPKTTTKSTTVTKTQETVAPKTESTTVTKTTKSTDTSKTSLVGCCSGHGGVNKCDHTTGFQLCKDGTHSTTCACAMTKKKK